MKLQLRRDKNCIELRNKNRLCKQALTCMRACRSESDDKAYALPQALNTHLKRTSQQDSSPTKHDTKHTASDMTSTLEHALYSE